MCSATNGDLHLNIKKLDNKSSWKQQTAAKATDKTELLPINKCWTNIPSAVEYGSAPHND